MEAERMRGRRNPHITMLAFIDPEERVPTVFTKNRARLLEDEVGQQLFDEVPRT
jgi:hypothetical protein